MFSAMERTKPSARILADSVSPDGKRLITLEATFHRFILAEMNTHRMFSRNSASSRAIPFEKMRDRVLNDPAVPVYWGKNQKGMQAGEELSLDEISEAIDAWLAARAQAVGYAQELHDIGVHKSIVNRVLEPYLWHTAIITATEWKNFFALRIDEHAQAEIRAVAEAMAEAIHHSEPDELDYDEWHLPMITAQDRNEADVETLLKVSVGRCARVSYMTHDGQRSLDADVALHDDLLTNGHMSPFEHQASPDRLGTGSGNFYGWWQYRAQIPNEHDYSIVKNAKATA